MASNKKILFFLISFNRGGAEWVITNLCNEMVSLGHSVTVISVSKGTMQSELDPAIEMITFNGQLFKSLAFLRKLLAANQFDVLFTTQRLASAYSYLALLISFSKTKFIVREAASNFIVAYSNKKGLNKLFWKTLYKLSYNYADKIIVNSQGTKNDLISAGIISDKKKNVFLINNPLDLEKIKSRSIEGIEQNPITAGNYIISIGRLVPKKNMDILIKAFAEITIQFPDLGLVIVGDGPEESNLSMLVNTLGLDHKVFMAGNLTNPYPLLKQAKVFILASSWEGFGMVIVEALALGVPVISSDIDAGPRQILNSGEFGTLIEPGSVTALQHAIVSKLNSHEDTSRLVDRADFFAKSRITREYLEVMFA